LKARAKYLYTTGKYVSIYLFVKKEKAELMSSALASEVDK
jgi:hypothetical protein